MDSSSFKKKIEIIRKHQKFVPVQVVPLAKELGLQVYRASGWPDDLSGAIRRVSDDEGIEASSGYAIYVNKDHHINRRRFTIAHEIAHFVLHTDDIGDGLTDDAMYRSELGSSKEYQANDFAAQILMPSDALDKYRREGKESAFELSQIFEVSQSAMATRLKRL